MHWLSVIAFALLMVGSFIVICRVDPFDSEAEGWKRIEEHVIWALRTFTYVLIFSGTIWMIWLKATGQL